MNRTQLKTELREGLEETLRVAEGFVPHAYKDHLGYWTIGFGRLIDKRRGGRIRESEAELMLDNDIDDTYTELVRHLPWVVKQPDPVIRGLLNMAYQMGVGGLLTFSKMLTALKDGRYFDAKTEGLDSRWSEQTPRRAARVTDLFASCQS